MESFWMEIVILFSSALVCIAVYVNWRFNHWKRRNIPYIKASFPMGNFEFPWAIERGFHQIMTDIYLEFKNNGYKHGGCFVSLRPVYLPVNLDILKNIMIKDFQHFVDRGNYHNEKSDPLSAHLFSVGGDKWRSLRTRLTPTFTSGKMKTMFHLVLECADGLQKEVDKLWKSNHPADIKELAALFTTNVIGSCAFGLDCNSFEDPKNEFRYHSKKIFDGGIVRAFRKLCTLSFPKLCERLGVKAFSTETSEFFIGVMRNIINHRESNNVRRNDFVQLLLDISTFTLEEISAQGILFFLAGFETSSSTMTFAFYEMAKNQDIQNKVREEIHRVLEKHHGKLTYEAIHEMTYMGQVFDETLRKYPILATLERICTKDYKVPGEDLLLKKGDKVLISIKGIHHDPEYYPEPEKFDPERFTPANRANLHTCAYIPFGEGPRNCIGMRFGIMQSKIGIATLLKDYKYSLNNKLPDMRLYSKASLLKPMGDIPLDIEKV